MVLRLDFRDIPEQLIGCDKRQSFDKILNTYRGATRHRAWVLRKYPST